MEQLLRVIILCEMVSLQVIGICSDAGGSNTSLFRALRNDKSLTETVWLDDHLVSFQNPIDPSRRVSIMTCSAHGQKAARNNMLNSQDKVSKKGSRSFVRNNTKFGWFQLVQLYGEDTTFKTKLNKTCIDPDRFSKMCVTDACAPFRFETIAFACTQLASFLPPYDALTLVAESVELQKKYASPCGSTEGYEAENLDGYLS
jgi:hypothetical protein